MFQQLLLVLALNSVCAVKEFEPIDNNLPGYDLEGIERAFRGQDKEIYRPCPVYDLLCIRRYLARHSNCKISEGPVPDPLYRTQSNLFFPSVNISATEAELEIRGLTGTVSAFNVNRESDVTVLGIDFRDLNQRSRKTTIRFHRRGQEPAVTATPSLEIFPSVTITTVFKGVKNIKLENSESVAFLNVPPIITFGPEAGENPDPTVPVRVAEIPANLATILPEGFLTASPFYAGTFIQYVLCDFGLKLD